MEANIGLPPPDKPAKGRRKGKKDDREDDGAKKRRCISSACVPCRKRKSKVRGVVFVHLLGECSQKLTLLHSAMVPRPPALPAQQYTTRHAFTTPTQTTAAKACIGRTWTG